MHFKRYKLNTDHFISNAALQHQHLMDEGRDLSADLPKMTQSETENFASHFTKHLEMISGQIGIAIGAVKVGGLNLKGSLPTQDLPLAIDIMNCYADQNFEISDAHKQEIALFNNLLGTACKYIRGEDREIDTVITKNHLEMPDKEKYKEYYRTSTQEFIGDLSKYLYRDLLNYSPEILTNYLETEAPTEFLQRIKDQSVITELHNIRQEQYKKESSTAKRNSADRSPEQEKKEERKKVRFFSEEVAPMNMLDHGDDTIADEKPSTGTSSITEATRKLSQIGIKNKEEFEEGRGL